MKVYYIDNCISQEVRGKVRIKDAKVSIVGLKIVF